MTEKKTELFIDEELWTAALNYFRTKGKALGWLRTPNLALGGECPGECCTSHYSGDKAVLELINKLKYGMNA